VLLHEEGSSVSGVVEIDVSEEGKPIISLRDLSVSIDFELKTQRTHLGWLVEVIVNHLKFDFCIEGFVNHFISSIATRFVELDLKSILEEVHLLIAPPAALKQEEPMDCMALDLSLCRISAEANHMWFWYVEPLLMLEGIRSHTKKPHHCLISGPI